MSRAALAVLFGMFCTLSAEAQNSTVTSEVQETTSVCDSAGFLQAAIKAEQLRKTRRVSAEEFARMAAEPHTVVLDARGKPAFENLHVKGALNLPYTEFSETSLQHIIPDKSTRILLYCRNNLVSLHIGLNKEFGSSTNPGPDLELEFEKGRAAGLNIPTYITLYIYGYRNVWELKPAVDPNDSPIPFVRPWERSADSSSSNPR